MIDDYTELKQDKENRYKKGAVWSGKRIVLGHTDRGKITEVFEGSSIILEGRGHIAIELLDKQYTYKGHVKKE